MLGRGELLTLCPLPPALLSGALPLVSWVAKCYFHLQCSCLHLMSLGSILFHFFHRVLAGSRLLLGSCWTMEPLRSGTKSCLSDPPCRSYSNTTSVYDSDLPRRSFWARFLDMSGSGLPHKVFQCSSGKLTLSNSLPASKLWFSLIWLHPSSVRVS